MAGGKETPRQKMIGMMYLVLTALLAMNVSKQILQGYLSVNESLVKSKQNLTENNSRVTKAFEASIGGNAAAKPYYEKALEISKPEEKTGTYKANVIEALEYLGYYHMVLNKNKTNADSDKYFNELKTIDPNNEKQKNYFNPPKTQAPKGK